MTYDSYLQDVLKRRNKWVAIKRDPSMPQLIVKVGQYGLAKPCEKLANSVDLFSLVKFIETLNEAEWVPGAYWHRRKNNFNTVGYSDVLNPGGTIHWAIYAYLRTTEMLLIEDEYYKPGERSEREFYQAADSYDNRFEDTLYQPIVQRLINADWIQGNKFQEKWSKTYKRYRSLNVILE